MSFELDRLLFQSWAGSVVVKCWLWAFDEQRGEGRIIHTPEDFNVSIPVP